ncbi:MAG: hypothetical protein WA882_01130 [Geitlerinemataceae cyanobacterium]
MGKGKASSDSLARRLQYFIRWTSWKLTFLESVGNSLISKSCEDFMKCIQCKTDSNYKERVANNGRCKKCGHPFTFEPKTNVEDTKDLLFKNSIDRASYQDRLYYTNKQLFYAIKRPLFQRETNEVKKILLYYFFCFIPVFMLIVPVFLGGEEFLNSPVFVWAIFLIFFLGLMLWGTVVGLGFELYYRAMPGYKKRIKIAGIGLIIEFSFLGAILSRVPLLGFLVFLMGVAAGLVLIKWSFYIDPKYKPSLQLSSLFYEGNIDRWIEKWTKVNGSLEKLLPPIEENIKENIDRTPIDEEIGGYSFDRLVVCDRPEIAQFLLANNFHREYNCAVVSVTGYPASIFTELLEILRQNPNLKVYALHDASPRGVSLYHTLCNSPNWFHEHPVEIFDMGLLPRQVFKTRQAVVQNSINSKTPIEPISPEVRQSLSRDEIVWLERGNFVELESFVPQKLLKIVAQCLAVNRYIQPAPGDLAFETESEFIVASDDFG